ncbi:hypothetical protein AX018_100429 [Paracidovorax anthurii]|uniref:Uncharacterized protein n=2 Tax=Paracidovorax anthurii TaxID=78229 RepID=A0A328ZTG7_9BURK|nr:hypothetical protein AX018_100429 [Paracidovorax anthurii]
MTQDTPSQAPRPARFRRMAGLAATAIAAALLAGCARQPPVPDWRLNAHDAATRATEAYLSGADRVAAQEWSRARAEVARTARPDLLARTVLLECAARVASLDATGCPAFEPLRADAADAERAYADYLEGRAGPAAAQQLPPAQRAVLAGGAPALAGVEDPLARLVAAGALVRRGGGTAEVARVAIDTASAQGWRRPLMAWLLHASALAAGRGDTVEAEALRRRLAVLERGGEPR